MKKGRVSTWEERQVARRFKELKDRQKKEIDETEVFNHMKKNGYNSTKRKG